MTATATNGEVVIIAADEYPAILTPIGAAGFLQFLASPEIALRAARLIELRRNELCDAVLEYITQLEGAAAASDLPHIYGHAHEIRGLAGTAGMDAAGRIADGLCLYLDGSKSRQSIVDPAVIALHVDAIVRASSSAEEAGKFGSRVAMELGALVTRKLDAVSNKKVKRA